jgi:hypothetical protein
MKVTMEIIYMSHITRADARKNPSVSFIFGDNDMRTGLGGLAKELRGEPNAYGIRVKKKPTLYKDSFYTDDEIKENINKITHDINNIVHKLQWAKDPVIIYPAAGIGTGLANMKQTCPETFHTMNLILEGVLGIKNGDFK